MRLPFAPRVLRRLGYALSSLLFVLLLELHPIQALGHPPITATAANAFPAPIQPFTGIEIAQAPLTEPPDTRDPNHQWQAGYQHYQAGHYTAAIDTWKQALQTYHRQNHALGQVLILNHMSAAYQQLRDWSSAQALLDRSTTLLAQQPETIEWAAVNAQVLTTQGSLQLAQGDAEAALQTWQQVAPLYTQLEDTHGHILNQINQANAQLHLGQYYNARTTLLNLQERLNQQPDPAIRMTGLYNLGHGLYLVGDYQAALSNLQQAQALADAQNDATTLNLVQLSLGNLYSVQAQPKQAVKAYQTVARSPDPLFQLQANTNLLDVYITQNRRRRAEALWPQIEAQMSQLLTGRQVVYHKIHLAESLTTLKRDLNSEAVSWQQISELLTSAHHQAQQLNDPLAQSNTMGHLGHLYELNQQWSQALKLTQQALKLSDNTTAADLAYQWQWQLGRIYAHQERYPTAIAAYQESVNILQLIRRDLAATPTSSSFSFQQNVEPVYRELVSILLEPGQPETPKHLEQAQTTIEALRAAELENFFRSACLNDREVPITDIDQGDAAVIYPILLPDRLEVIYSLPDKTVQHRTVPVTATTVSQTAAKLRQIVEEPITTRQGKRKLAEAYDWLIRPILPTFDQQAVQTLVFVLDGPLRNVPMSALYDGQQYLIETYRVALAPGMRLLDPKPLPAHKLNVLAAGLTQSRHRLPPLKYVRTELEEIDKVTRANILLDEEFTADQLSAQAQNRPFPIIHLATHGHFSSQVEETFVAAWDQRIPVSQLQTLLRSSEQHRPTPIEMLVLSACQTAQGDEQATLGLAGVALQAGARSTVGSLWTLDDQTGAEFMATFYQQLHQSPNKAEALRQAQLSLLHTPDHRAPRFWSTYVLIGNWL